MGPAAETVLLHLTQLLQPTPLAPVPTCPACSPVPADVSGSLLPPGGALQRGPSSPPSLPLHHCRLVMSVYGHCGLASLFSLYPSPGVYIGARHHLFVCHTERRGAAAWGERRAEDGGAGGAGGGAAGGGTDCGGHPRPDAVGI